VVGADGVPVGMCVIRFEPDGHDAPERSAQVGADGTFEATGLRAGAYRVSLRASRESGWAPLGTVRAGARDLTLTAPE
jgi:hypothetical protein